MNILVTGAKGMVGRALVNNLRNIKDGKIIEAGKEEALIKVPEAVDKEVARRKLEFLGKHIDTLSDKQKEYLESSGI